MRQGICFYIGVGLFLFSQLALSAQLLELDQEKASALKQLLSTHALNATLTTPLKQTAVHVGHQHQTHVRFIQQYQGLRIYDAEGVVHFQNVVSPAHFAEALMAAPSTTSMSGQVYQNIDSDLANTPPFHPTHEAQLAALSFATKYYAAQSNVSNTFSNQHVEPIVYVNSKTQKARYGYLVNFLATPETKNTPPARMLMLLDASDYSVYLTENRLMTETPELLSLNLGGGLGGNQKMGQLVYDGLSLQNHYLPFQITRDASEGWCRLKNNEVSVNDYTTGAVVSFSCSGADEHHANLYWDGALGAVNGGYSPANDALFAGSVIKALYKTWYHLEVLTEANGDPMPLVMRVNYDWDNAAWAGNAMIFGNGVTLFYPLTSLGIAAHEISHGFTEQNSNLYYDHESGAINESFSDMAAKAAEVYAYGHVLNWSIGEEVMKEPGVALRYMDRPSKDCLVTGQHSGCSIDTASDYKASLNVHYSSGVYNRAFYLLATAPGWDVKKAFGVMVYANQNYWTPHATFSQAACGVLKSASELGEGTDAVSQAFEAVGVSLQHC